MSEGESQTAYSIPTQGQKFSSFEGFKTFMNEYERNVVKRFRLECGHKINNDIIQYHSFKYVCRCSGTYNPKSRKSSKCECPALLKVKKITENDVNYLEIIECKLEHNEACNQQKGKCLLKNKYSMFNEMFNNS